LAWMIEAAQQGLAAGGDLGAGGSSSSAAGASGSAAGSASWLYGGKRLCRLC